MIEVTYYRRYHRLTVTGHAGSGEYGHDLVCASAAILAYTLAANVANMADAGQVRNAVIRLNKGDGEIACSPKQNLKSIVTLAFDSVCIGFALLAKDHPEYIRYEVRH
jgi:uncharacterized protein YsxB (DUF464 family)